jgi:hypothetical protein
MADKNLRVSPHSLNFQHRNNKDGTCDSICLRCYRTVASTRQEEWLAHEESIHTCTLLDLHAWMSDRALSRF